MFKRVELHNFRSCAAVEIDDAGEIVALLGRNGAGKTNVLMGLQWIAESAVSTAISTVTGSNRRLTGRDTAATVEIGIRDRVYLYSIRVSRRAELNAGVNLMIGRNVFTESLDVNVEGGWTRLLTRDDESIWLGEANVAGLIRVGTRTSMMMAVSSLLPPDSPVLVDVNRVIEFMKSVRYYPADTPPGTRSSSKGLVRYSYYRRWAGIYAATGAPGNSVEYRILHMFLARPEKFECLQDLLRDKLGVLEAINVRRSSAGLDPDGEDPAEPLYYAMTFTPCEGGKTVDYGDLSFGTRRVVRIAVSLVFDESSVLLVEQPEDGIHASLTKKLVGAYRSFLDPAQVFFATHSTFVLNSLRPDELRLVAMTDGQTTVRPLTHQERSIAENYMTEEGTLADFVSMVEE